MGATDGAGELRGGRGGWLPKNTKSTRAGAIKPAVSGLKSQPMNLSVLHAPAEHTGYGAAHKV
mgnify:CR=1 FL=1